MRTTNSLLPPAGLSIFRKHSPTRFCFALLAWALLANPARAEVVYWADWINGDVGRANVDGTAIQTIAVATNFAAGVMIDESTQKVYWAENGRLVGSIQRSNLDGSNRETFLGGLENPAAVAIEPSSGRVYWASGPQVDKVQIYSAALDGSDVKLLASNLGGISGFAFDSANGKLYWADQARRTIVVANLDGTSPTTILDNLDSPIGLGLDAFGRMYWVSYTNWTVLRANVDGSNLETIVSAQPYPAGVMVDSLNSFV